MWSTCMVNGGEIFQSALSIADNSFQLDGVDRRPPPRLVLSMTICWRKEEREKLQTLEYHVNIGLENVYLYHKEKRCPIHTKKNP